MNSIMERLEPASRRLVKTLLVENIKQAKTPEFQDVIRQELAGYGWQSEKIEQAMAEIEEIIRQGH